MISGDLLNGTMVGNVGDVQQFNLQTADYVTDLDGHSATNVASITPTGYLACLAVGQCYVYLQNTFHVQWTLTVNPAPEPEQIDGPTDYMGLPFVEAVCRSVLDQSSIIQGRFALGTEWGGEINALDISIPVNALPQKQKYPCAILYPAVATGRLQDYDPSGYVNRSFYMLFLAGAHVTGQNAINKPAPNLQSQHTIQQTWHDMERCALGFMRALQHAIDVNIGYSSTIHFSSIELPQIQTVTELGNDKVSGVCLKFDMRTAANCGYGDYASTINAIVLPDPNTDPHPLHKDI